MPVPHLFTPAMLAYHGTTHTSGSGSVAVLFVFLGILATAGWLIFSELRWRHTILVTVAGWIAVFALSVTF